MNIEGYLIVGGAVFFIVLLFVQALCRAAADADRAMGLKD